MRSATSRSSWPSNSSSVASCSSACTSCPPGQGRTYRSRRRCAWIGGSSFRCSLTPRGIWASRSPSSGARSCGGRLLGRSCLRRGRFGLSCSSTGYSTCGWTLSHGRAGESDASRRPREGFMTNNTDITGGRVCIVGAGPAGLSAARSLKRLGIHYDHYERHSDVGGIWDLDNPGTPMYESAHFISSRKTSGFFDFPMPDSFPDYPSHRQILDYTREFAATHGLREQIRFGTALTGSEHEGDRWTVALSDGSRHAYRALVCATGTTWSPRMPTIPGSFIGEVRHSATYRDP